MLFPLEITEQTSFTKMFLSGTHFMAEWTEAMQTKCLADQGHNILMIQPGSINVAKNQHFTHITNMLHICFFAKYMTGLDTTHVSQS